VALNLRAAAELPCPLEVARAELETLDGYPQWLGIVMAVEDAPPADPGGHPAWWVELGGRIGLVRKTKRVRMERTFLGPDRIRFERVELDGRQHNEWVLEAQLEAKGPDRTDLDMTVYYGGERRIPVLDAVLRAEVRRAGRRLVERVAAVG
jgi:hypothetical protein